MNFDKLIIVWFYPLNRAVQKLKANGTYIEQKSAYSELQLYPSVTICIDPGAVRYQFKIFTRLELIKIFSGHYYPVPQV